MSNKVALTPQTAALVLAYMHHYTCKFLPKRCLSPTHLNRLATWIGQPAVGLRTARAHQPLAAHLAVLSAAELVDTQGGQWVCTPAAFAWLAATSEAQLAALLTSLQTAEVWSQTLAEFGFEEVLPLDYTAYLQQTLARQRERAAPAADLATWVEATNEEAWLLDLPQNLPTDLLFDLLQLGQWRPGGPNLRRQRYRGFAFGTVRRDQR